ncbi:hypothetical protein FGIG_07343 [Fasciola gigantica]|uniref:Uncharacterized protein n=1 Tax=Fasciola gigantica TaxID=46835 RepID=A0A504Z1X7_FASGI|nr:hypothetical protein FGIG_07343 [Fasciola gigantica]
MFLLPTSLRNFLRIIIARFLFPLTSSETLNASTFHWIYDQVMHYREMLLSDKRGGGTNRRAIQASRRLELAVMAYQEFLVCLSRMIRVTDADRLPDPELEETPEIVEERLRIQANAAENIMGESQASARSSWLTVGSISFVIA